MNRFNRPGGGIVLGFIVGVFIGLLALLIVTTATADAHFTASCKKSKCKHHVIKPYEMNFLRFTGHCESRVGHSYGSRHGELKTGLRAYNSAGYFGRYQFGWSDWHRAGGKGDPRRAGWLEQAYRAVVWLHINGRQSWPHC